MPALCLCRSQRISIMGTYGVADENLTGRLGENLADGCTICRTQLRDVDACAWSHMGRVKFPPHIQKGGEEENGVVIKREPSRHARNPI